MPDVNNLMSRIDAEFAASEKKIKDFQAHETREFQGRKERLELFAKACEMLRETWRPPLEALAAKFGEKVKVTPSVSPTSRDATFQFRSPLATIDLRFSASTDFEVHNLVLDYDLHVLPILMKMEPHARAEFPLESVDSEAVRRWIDDRIIDFVKTYLSLHENENYLRDHLVADPISATRFPKYAAAETLEWKGTRYYFVAKETRAEFEKKNGITSK